MYSLNKFFGTDEGADSLGKCGVPTAALLANAAEDADVRTVSMATLENVTRRLIELIASVASRFTVF